MQSANGTRRRRRRYIIDPRFQWKFGLWLMADVFVVCLAMGMLLLLIQNAYSRSLLLEAQAIDWGRMALMLIVFALGFAVVAAGAFGLWSVMLTHRLCGPLHIIGVRLAELAEGRFPEWRPLRKKDECKELYKQLWATIDSLKTSKQADFDALTEILSTARAAKQDDEAGRKRALDDITARVSGMRTSAAEALGIECNDPPPASKPKQDSVATPVALCGECRGGPSN
jgi:hypothetical protein